MLLMGGLNLFLTTQQPYQTYRQVYFVCKLAVVKYFDRLTMWVTYGVKFNRCLCGHTDMQ